MQWSLCDPTAQAFTRLFFTTHLCNAQEAALNHTLKQMKKANSDIEIPLLRWKMKDGKGRWMVKEKELELEKVVDDEGGEEWRYR